MTPENLNTLVDAVFRVNRDPLDALTSGEVTNLRIAIKDAIEVAVEEERNACATLADIGAAVSPYLEGSDIESAKRCRRVAQSIRARGNKAAVVSCGAWNSARSGRCGVCLNHEGDHAAANDTWQRNPWPCNCDDYGCGGGCRS